MTASMLIRVESSERPPTTLVAVEIGTVTLESNLVVFDWKKMKNCNISNRQKVKYKVYSYNRMNELG